MLHGLMMVDATDIDVGVGGGVDRSRPLGSGGITLERRERQPSVRELPLVARKGMPIGRPEDCSYRPAYARCPITDVDDGPT